ncbi:MAG: insulinase family protein [Candidatus Tectomicrobia bacterium]|uniref:Insulinase family protein n=1 Tax=Tectimicrobiota bacterium TaxID=2528274 RepID=A0A932CLL7_UNCTE|nr:insulinase family protein [Candidatus Tectomicrobia bacterium]
MMQRDRLSLLPVVILGLCLLASSSWAAPKGRVQETRLPNGLKVLTKEVHAAPVVTTYVWYRVGARNENVGTTGVAHQVEHLLFKGTQKLKAGEIDRIISGAGGENNAFTSHDYTAYYITLPKDKLEIALKIEADRMVNSRISPQDLASEKRVVLSELEGDENDPQEALDEVVQGTSFLAHPYRWPVGGFKSDVQAFTPESVRSFYRRYYLPNNATLVIVGDFRTEAVLPKVRQLFGSIPRGPAPPPVVTVEPPQRGERRVVVKREGSTAYLQVQYHVGPLSHPDTYPLSVLDSALTGGRSSRLYRALVETQLATSVYSQLHQAIDPGWFSFSVTVRQGVEPSKVEEVLLAELEKVKTEPLTPRELQKAVNQTKAQFIYADDSVSSQASHLGYFETVASHKLLDTYVDRIRQVKADEVKRVTGQYLSADNRTVGHLVPLPPKGPAKSPGPGAEGGGQGPKRRSLDPFPAGGSAAPSLLFLPGIGDGVRGPRPFRQTLAAGPAQAGDPARPAWRTKSYRSSGGRSLLPDLAPGALLAYHTSKPQARSDQLKTWRMVLPNGMVLIVRENHANQTVALAGHLKAGSMYDPPDKPGLASLTASLLDRGTEKHTSQEIAEQLDFVGASLNTGAGIEGMNFSAYSLSENFEEVLGLLGEVLLRPAFPEAEIEKVRGEVLSALKQEEDDPGARAGRTLNALLFPPGHPYHHDSSGTEEGVKKIRRDDLLSFYRRHYRPDTSVFVIVGDVSASQVKAQIEKIFASWQAQGERPAFSIPSVPLSKQPLARVIPMQDKSEVIVRLGHQGISRHNPDYYACTVMNHILGGGNFGSRLMKELREKEGLTYGVYTFFRASLGEGPWTAYLQVNPRDTQKAIEKVKENLKRLQEKGVSPQELKAAQDYLVGRLPLSMESNAGIASTLLSQEVYRLGMDYVERYPALIRSVTPDQIKAMARKYLHPERLTVVVAGPYEGKL